MADKLSPDSFFCWLTSTVVLAGNRLDDPSGTRGESTLHLANFDGKLIAKPPDASRLRRFLMNNGPSQAAQEGPWRTTAKRGGEAPTDLSTSTSFMMMMLSGRF
ncbi:hypothetical protein [Ktedonobacter sp. SOSP1-52]|uniref:hypothetical protein n=1 Tax=Ktedonobacter sp. SOSP1-52 TaxID=2778366 RepID=UPI00191619BF|nr:hypothetical protein [Ktedonobacter sp. SOSP1-52]